MYLYYFSAYAVIMTLLGIAVMGIDKRKAILRKRRIPEKTLFLIAAAGGSIGVLLGMFLFRHKTKHLSFELGIPAILILQAALVTFIIRNLK